MELSDTRKCFILRGTGFSFQLTVVCAAQVSVKRPYGLGTSSSASSGPFGDRLQRYPKIFGRRVVCCIWSFAKGTNAVEEPNAAAGA